MENKPDYEELVEKLADAEEIIRVLRKGEVDAVVGTEKVLLLRLKEAEEELEKQRKYLEELAWERSSLLENLKKHQAELETQADELQLTRREAQVSRDRYIDLFEFAPVGYFILDRHFQIAEANFTGSLMLGIASASLNGKNFTRFIAPSSRDVFHQCLGKAGKEKVRDCEIELCPQNGAPFYAWLKVKKAYPADDQYMVAVLDITERKTAEKALRASEERYRTLFNSIDQGFCVVEVLFDENEKPVDYRFLEVNPAFEGQTGLSNAVGKRMKELKPLHEEHWFQIYGRIALTGEPQRFTNLAKYLNNRWYDVFAFRIGRPEEHRVAILFADISERKKSEQMKDDFLSLVSHELRTPITVIAGSLKVAMDGVASPEDVRDLLQNAADNADMLTDILENMLELTRHRTGRLQLDTVRVDIRTLVEKVIHKLEAYGATQLFHVELPDGLPPVKADPLRVERILYNLLENAVKYSPAESRISVLAQVENDFLVTRIVDQGNGISREDRDRLFQPFIRLDESVGTTGIGLGLIVCQRLLEAQGGWIKVESEVGQGSAFSFGLPLYSVS
jgi:PAS domain S-box-containing protein